MGTRTPQEMVESVVRDLDLVVYRLERAVVDVEMLRAERVHVRRELERLRDALGAVSMSS